MNAQAIARPAAPLFSHMVMAQVKRHSSNDNDDPAAWVHDRLGEELWSKQREIMQRLRQVRRLAVKSAHGLGKSHIASRIAAEFLDDNPVGEAFLVTTAPSANQVRMILWRYIGQAHRKGNLIGRVNQVEWLVDNEPIGMGRKPSDYDDDTFQGIHALKVLVIIDEAGGVVKSLWDSVEALLTNEDCKVLAIGNPDDATSHFADVCKPTSGWDVMTISAFDSPNFTGEDVSPRLRKLLVGPQYVEDAKRNWGEDSALYTSKVLGEFPIDSEDGVIPGSGIARCRNIGIELIDEDVDDETEDVQLGVDVGAGGDQSVLRERRGNRAGRVWRSRHNDPMRLVGEIVTHAIECKARRVAIDVIGVGWGVAGRLEEVFAEQGLKIDVIKVNVGQKSVEPKRFVNLRAELWWNVGRMLTQDDAWDLTAIDDQTAADLAAPKYVTDSAGRIKVEKKDEVRARIGRSPDDADALLLAFCTDTRRAVMHRPRNLEAQTFAGRPGQATVGAR